MRPACVYVHMRACMCACVPVTNSPRSTCTSFSSRAWNVYSTTYLPEGSLLNTEPSLSADDCASPPPPPAPVPPDDIDSLPEADKIISTYVYISDNYELQNIGKRYKLIITSDVEDIIFLRNYFRLSRSKKAAFQPYVRTSYRRLLEILVTIRNKVAMN